MPDLTIEEVQARLAKRQQTQDSKEDVFLNQLQGKTIPPREDLKISDYNWQDYFRNNIAPTLRGFGNAAGEAVGTAGGLAAAPFTGGASVPAGFIGGGLAADQLYQIGARLSPRTLGDTPSNPFQALKESATWVAGDTAFTKGIPLLKKLIKTKLFDYFLPPNPNIPVRDALQHAPSDLNLTVGQTTQNRAAKDLEDLVTSERIMEPKIAAQQSVLRREIDKTVRGITGEAIPGSTTTQQLARVSQQSAATKYQAAHTVRRKLYDEAKENISQVKKPGFIIEDQPPTTILDARGNPITKLSPPKLISTEIQGPIYPTRSGDFAKTVISDIDEYIKDPTNRNFETIESMEGLKAIKKRLQTFIKGEMVDADFKPVMTYKTADQDIKSLNQLLKTTSPNAQNRLYESIKAVRGLLSADVRESAKGWGNDKAATSLFKAQDYHNRMFTKVYGPELTKKLAKVGKFSNDPNLNQEELFRMGLKDATIASQIVHATGSRKPLATEYVKEFMSSLSNKPDMLGGVGGVKYLEDTKEVAGKLLTSDQRASLKYLSRLVQASTYERGNTGKVALMIRGVGAVFGILGGSITLSRTGSIPQGLTTGGVILATVPYTMNELSEMMLNPANARLAARLVSLNPSAPEAISIQKKLFRTALRGVRFHLQTAAGEELGLFTPREDGKLEKVEE